MMVSIVQCLVVFCCVHYFIIEVHALSNCQEVADESIFTLFRSAYPSLPDEAELGDVYYTCKAQSTISRNYHSLSVIITFTYNVTTAAKQFELECIATDVWDGRAGSVMNVSESFNYTTITARTDCSSCTNTAGNDYHCEACDAACNNGSSRCTGPGPNDCCPVFNFFACADSCPDNRIAGEFTDYECVLKSCPLPDINTLVHQVQSYLGSSISLRAGPFYTCQAQGIFKDTYRELSVVIEYTLNASAVDGIGHFRFECFDNEEFIALSMATLSGANYNGSLGLRTDCRHCRGSLGSTTDNPCLACPQECNQSDGLNLCDFSGKCCTAFEDDGWCKTDLNCNKETYIANQENNYTCSRCDLSSCPDGYTLDSTICACTLTDICVAGKPCSNNGVCVLDAVTSDHYTCNCTGTGYTGTNCSECSLICQRGYVINDDCMCVLDDICVADNPCSNDGTCVLGSSPDQYSCQCVGNWSGINCTSGGSRFNDSAVNSTASSGDKDYSSSFKWWHVGLPVILLVVLVILAVVIIVGAVVIFKMKQEKHDITSNEIILKSNY